MPLHTYMYSWLVQVQVTHTSDVVQVVKVAVPVYYGSRYQCEKVPQHQVIKAVQSKKVHFSLTADAKAAMTVKKTPAIP